MKRLNLLVLLPLSILTTGKKIKLSQSNSNDLVVEYGSIQCICGNKFTVERLHEKRIKDIMEIARSEIVEIQICDTWAKIHIEINIASWSWKMDYMKPQSMTKINVHFN